MEVLQILWVNSIDRLDVILLVYVPSTCWVIILFDYRYHADGIIAEVVRLNDVNTNCGQQGRGETEEIVKKRQRKEGVALNDEGWRLTW